MGSKSKVGLPELKMRKEDGSLFSRLEMEQQLREETVYARRLRAVKIGLPNKIAQHMLPISVTHWLLDYWVHNQQVSGEVLGIRAEFSADDNKEYVQQLTQRLALFVEHGLAIVPLSGEGIDMTQFPTQPGFPPMPMQNGQQGAPTFAPPPPPPMPGMPMQMPQTLAPPQFQQPPMAPQQPQQFAPPMPGMPPQPQQPPMNMAPPMPMQPPSQQNFPPQMAMPQPQQPQQGNGGMQAPMKADPTRQWGQAGKRENGEQRTRRTKEELAEDATYEQWKAAGGDPNVGMGAAPQQQQAPQQMQSPPMMAPPQMGAPQMQMPMTAPPNPFGGMGGPAITQPNFPQQQAPQGFPQPSFPGMPQMAPPPVPQAAPVAQATVQTISTDHLATKEQITEVLQNQSLIKTGIAQLLRIMYSKPGDPDLYLVLTEVCGVRPPQ